MSIITAMLTFILTIVILVGIHEFGHYWVAKRLGVKVLRFSIGFGKVLKSWHWGETEFVICALPLGGYVKMLDKREDKVDDAEKHREFTAQNVYKRIAIVLAGPLSNLIFAVLVYSAIFMIGTHGIRPVIDTVKTDSIAFHAGLNAGDEIININLTKTLTVQNVLEELLKNSLNSNVNMQVISADGQQSAHTLTLPDDLLADPKSNLLATLGFSFAVPKLAAIIDEVIANSPADKAGLKAGDKVISSNDTNIDSWQTWVNIIRQSAGQNLEVLIERENSLQTIMLTPEQSTNQQHATIGVKVFIPDNFGEQYQILDQKNITNALTSAVSKVYDLSVLMLKMMAKMVSGSVSLQHISGPVSIANYASQSIQIGLITFLGFLAVISISLGVLNLLPIPMLDGGHLLYYIIEIIKGSPVSEKTQLFFQRFGMVFILLLMLIAVYNDVLNLI